ncbi:hypothetical protein FACS1894184_09980 [Clostridia bacterium]|nr:hypothetical protein FACS1894184_09980 [Clostridia bacterium]
MITSMSLATDGAITAAAKDSAGAWSLLTWRDIGGEPEILPLTIEGDISSISIAPDGQLLAVLAMQLSVGNLNGNSNGNSNRDSGGNAVTSSGGNTPGAPDGINFNVNRMSTSIVWFDGNGGESVRVSIQSIGSVITALGGRRFTVGASMMSGGAGIYDENGSLVVTLDANDVVDVAARGDSLFVLTEGSVIEYDASTGAKITSYAVNAGYQGRLAAGLDGRLYVNANEGLYWIEPERGVAEKCMNVSSTIMGDPSVTLAGFGVLADGTVVALTTSGSGLSIVGGGRVAFQIGASESADSTLPAYIRLDAKSTGNTLSIVSMYDSVILRKAVSIFARQHPEVEVVLRIEAPDGDNTPIADHIRTLNTDLLAGKSGDILILDDLPISNYISKGVLRDITSLVNSLGLAPGIRSGSEASGGKVYAVPAQFTFGAIWGRADVLDGVESLEDLLYSNLNDGQSPFSARMPEEWLRLFYPAAQQSFRDSKGVIQFNTPEFETFLNTLYEFYTAQDEMNTLNIPNWAGRAVSTAGRFGINAQEMLALYNGSAAYSAMTVGSLMSLSAIYSLAGGTESAVITTPGIGGFTNTYIPHNLVGINARSSQQAYAEEFIRALFSDEAQSADTLTALPSTVAELDDQFQSAIERSADGGAMRMGVPGGVNIEIVQPSEEAWAALRALCNMVDTPVTVDETLMGFLVEETASFFDGREPAAQAAQAVQQRALYYLNE